MLNPIIVQVLQQFRPQSMPGVRASLSPSKAWKMAGGIRAWKTYGKFGFQFLAYQPWNRISPKCEVQNTLDMDVSAVHWIWMYLQMGASNTLKYQIVAVIGNMMISQSIQSLCLGPQQFFRQPLNWWSGTFQALGLSEIDQNPET